VGGEKCMACQSSTLILDGLVFDQGLHADGLLTVGFQGDPRAAVFRQETNTSTAAVICVRCGFVQIHATDPATLAAAYRKILWRKIEKAQKEGTRPEIRSCPVCVTVLGGELVCAACGWRLASGGG